MEMELEKIRKNIRQKKHKEEKIETKGIPNCVIRFMITIALTLTCLIGLKKSESFKELFYKNIYETNFSFATINSIYQKYFGDTLPIDNLLVSNTEPVFSETFTYSSQETYMDGTKFIVSDKYLMPVLESGMIVFSGEKEGYGNTIIVQQVDGVDVWYSNITSNVKLYDYIEKGDVLGEVNGNYMYIVLKKDGNFIKYEEYM